MTLLGTKHLLMVVGGYDKNIHCYTCEREAPAEPFECFKYEFSLTGHMDSIKCLQFTGRKFAIGSDASEEQYLASCSQDHNIRLWKLLPLDQVKSQLMKVEKKEEGEGDEDDIDAFRSKTSYLLTVEGE